MKKDQIKHTAGWYEGRVYDNKDEFFYDLLSARGDQALLTIILNNGIKAIGRWGWNEIK